MNKYLRGITSILPALAIAAASFGAQAQSGAPEATEKTGALELLFKQRGLLEESMSAQRVLAETISSKNLDALRRHNLRVQATVIPRPDLKVCLVATALTGQDNESGASRVANPVKSVATDVKTGESMVAACERAGSKSVAMLIGTSDIPEEQFKKVAVWLDPAKEVVHVGKRKLNISNIVHNDTLSQAGVNEVAKVLGARWSRVVDHNVMSAMAILMTAKTESGKTVCGVMIGMTSTSADSRSALHPSNVEYFSTMDPVSDCTNYAVTNAAKHLRDNMPSLYPDINQVAEKGVKYPSASQFKKTLAAYDAKAAKEAKAAALKQAKATKTSPSTSVSCNYSCKNNMCERVFDNGRKDVIRVPMVFNHQTKIAVPDTWNICMR